MEWQQTEWQQTEWQQQAYQMAHNIIKERMVTQRGTNVEMVQHHQWGMTCYMDQTIQSSEIDEQLYHEALVHPAMLTAAPKRVMIIGGGEGATVREVLKWPSVTHVDMYEWDRDVVQLFETRYPQWAKNAWMDPRLTLHYDDIFEVIDVHPVQPYDVIIVDLFDPSCDTQEQWRTLLQHLMYWVHPTGSVVLYAGMRSIVEKEQPYQMLTRLLMKQPDMLFGRIIYPYHVYIPSFEGESVFLLISSTTGLQNSNLVASHITEPVWNSYQTFNW